MQAQCGTSQTLILQVSRSECLKTNNPIFMQISFAVTEMKGNIPYTGGTRRIISEQIVLQNFPLSALSSNALCTELFRTQGGSMVRMHTDLTARGAIRSAVCWLWPGSWRCGLKLYSKLHWKLADKNRSVGIKERSHSQLSACLFILFMWPFIKRMK